jgi:hypothetical protein
VCRVNAAQLEGVAIVLRQLAENIRTLPEGIALDASVDAYVACCHIIIETTGATITHLMGAAAVEVA